MNDKIKELMTKCNYVVDGTCDTIREEKFAELIIRECIDVGLLAQVERRVILNHFGFKPRGNNDESV